MQFCGPQRCMHTSFCSFVGNTKKTAHVSISSTTRISSWQVKYLKVSPKTEDFILRSIFEQYLSFIKTQKINVYVELNTNNLLTVGIAVVQLTLRSRLCIRSCSMPLTSVFRRSSSSFSSFSSFANLSILARWCNSKANVLHRRNSY